MNHAMKQRLVGILVLGCLAVIIIPLLLDGEGIQPPPLSATIPPEPEFPTTTIPEPTRPTIIADSLPVEGDINAEAVGEGNAGQPPMASSDDSAVPALPAYDPDEQPSEEESADSEQPDALEAAVAAIMAESRDDAATSADATPRLDSSGLPAAYVVRLGSFGEKANADALVKQLLDAEYKAYSRSVSTANGVFNAVYVGPVITRAEANDLRGTLSSRFQLNGVVENYTMQSQQ